MNELIILSSLAVVIAAYIMIVVKDKSFFHILTPIYFTFVPGYYLLELVHMHYFGYSAQSSTYLYCYATYGLTFLFLALVYTRFPAIQVKLPFNVNSDIKYLPYLFFSLAVLLYLPILIEYRELILTPRAIYAKTRVGYGHLYFTSTAFAYLAYIFCLFKTHPFKGEKVLFFLMCALWCFAHGSKGQVVILILIGLMYRVLVRDMRMKFSTVVVCAIAFALGLGSLFYAFSESMREGDLSVLAGVSTYSDYNRNAMMLIEDNPETQFGRLTLETAVFSRVPRVLYPNKPHAWGTFALANKYYPVWFEKRIGSASFGVLGVPFADFGYFAILYLIFWAGVTGVLLKIFVTRLKEYRDPSDFIIVLFLANVGIIPSGVGYTLPEHLFLALLVSILLRIRINWRRGVPQPDMPQLRTS